MDLTAIENLMVEHGVAIRIRAIPKTVISVYEVRHKKNYPNGVVEYKEQFKRNMLVVTTTPKDAGKFYLRLNKDRNSIARFDNKPCFDSLQEIVEYLQNIEKSVL